MYISILQVLQRKQGIVCFINYILLKIILRGTVCVYFYVIQSGPHWKKFGQHWLKSTEKVRTNADPGQDNCSTNMTRGLTLDHSPATCLPWTAVSYHLLYRHTFYLFKSATDERVENITLPPSCLLSSCVLWTQTSVALACTSLVFLSFPALNILFPNTKPWSFNNSFGRGINY